MHSKLVEDPYPIILRFVSVSCGIPKGKNSSTDDHLEKKNKTYTVKSRAVDRSTIQFWDFMAKGHSI